MWTKTLNAERLTPNAQWRRIFHHEDHEGVVYYFVSFVVKFPVGCGFTALYCYGAKSWLPAKI